MGMAMPPDTASEIPIEQTTEQIKSAVGGLLPRPHFKPRVSYREPYWLITVSISPKFRGRIPLQVQLPERVAEVQSCLEKLGLIVSPEDVANPDLEHVRWLMAAPSTNELETGRARRREWYGRGWHGLSAAN
jgi:hypothetical protein